MASQALAHPYLAQYADPTDEPASPAYDQTFEDHDLTVQEWKGGWQRNILIYTFISDVDKIHFETIYCLTLCFIQIGLHSSET